MYIDLYLDVQTYFERNIFINYLMMKSVEQTYHLMENYFDWVKLGSMCNKFILSIFIGVNFYLKSISNVELILISFEKFNNNQNLCGESEVILSAQARIHPRCYNSTIALAVNF